MLQERHGIGRREYAETVPPAPFAGEPEQVGFAF
jgi:hypothetical protein